MLSGQLALPAEYFRDHAGRSKNVREVFLLEAIRLDQFAEHRDQLGGLKA